MDYLGVFQVVYYVVLVLCLWCFFVWCLWSGVFWYCFSFGDFWSGVSWFLWCVLVRCFSHKHALVANWGSANANCSGKGGLGGDWGARGWLRYYHVCVQNICSSSSERSIQYTCCHWSSGHRINHTFNWGRLSTEVPRTLCKITGLARMEPSAAQFVTIHSFRRWLDFTHEQCQKHWSSWLSLLLHVVMVIGGWSVESFSH